MPVKWAGWGSSTLDVLLLALCRIQHCAVTSSPCGIWHVWNSKLTLRFLWPLGVQPSLESQINLKNTLATGGIENAFYCGFVGVSWWQVEQRCYWMSCGDCSCGHRSLAGLAVGCPSLPIPICYRLLSPEICQLLCEYSLAHTKQNLAC